MAFTLQLNTTQIEYQRPNLNKICKSTDILRCVFDDNNLEETCNIGTMDCLNPRQFSDGSITREQTKLYLLQLTKAQDHTKNTIWCYVKAYAYSIVSLLTSILSYTEPNIKDIIQEQKKALGCTKNLLIDLSTAFDPKSEQIYFLGESTELTETNADIDGVNLIGKNYNNMTYNHVDM